MTGPKEKASAGMMAEASCDLLGRRSRLFDSADNHQAQFLETSHHVRPNMAPTIAAIVFGGRHHG